MAKLAFSGQLIPLYADHVARTIAAIRGKSRRVLILDLDNTVWAESSRRRPRRHQDCPGDATGEAHLAVQQLALDLRQRGIVLAVSSKNTTKSRAPLRKSIPRCC